MFDIALICTIVLGFMGFADKIPSGNWWRWLNNTFLKIAVFLSATLLSAYHANQKDLATAAKIATTDSLNNIKEDSLHNDFVLKLQKSNQADIDTFTNVLAAYHLKYAAAQKKITQILKDSIHGELPGIAIVTGDIEHQSTNDSLTFVIPISNTGNCPVTVTLYVYTAVQDFAEKYYIGKMRAYNEAELAQSMEFKYPLRFYMPRKPESCIIWFKGEYSNESKSIQHKIDELVIWTKKINSVSSPVSTYEKASWQSYFILASK